jgi:hypothetical protein
MRWHWQLDHIEGAEVGVWYTLLGSHSIVAEVAAVTIGGSHEAAIPAPSWIVDQRLSDLLRPLLERILHGLRPVVQTPLQFEIDASGLACAAWRSFTQDVSAEDRALLQDDVRICSALDGLLLVVLKDADEIGADLPLPDARRYSGTDGEAPMDRLRRLAEWTQCLCNVLRNTHPQSLEFVGLRAEGFSSREIATKSGTGKRLVRRVLADVRAAHFGHDSQEDATCYCRS